MRSHIFTDGPWLAADPTPAWWDGSLDGSEVAVFQTGAWILKDERHLPRDLQAFLDAGEPPVYVGFGSVRAPQGFTTAAIQTSRRFPRVAAVVHHGRAGTTTTAAAAGAPQVIVPQTFDQFCFADRVERLGIGIGSRGAHHPASEPSGDSSESIRVALHHALDQILNPDVAATAHAVASKLRSDGASVAPST